MVIRKVLQIFRLKFTAVSALEGLPSGPDRISTDGIIDRSVAKLSAAAGDIRNINFGVGKCQHQQLTQIHQ
ncbi:UNVERIFIED_CONTAM: hypothetical protein PYX00_002868 [Menopon gallinae]|uniref:Uncharacterized protein n=1 Tax=Menopon gallinae TaxID=328185 RepID=A0AAW2HY86_9NEOP